MKLKKILSALIAAVMTAGVLPIMASAATVPESITPGTVYEASAFGATSTGGTFTWLGTGTELEALAKTLFPDLKNTYYTNAPTGDLNISVTEEGNYSIYMLVRQYRDKGYVYTVYQNESPVHVEKTVAMTDGDYPKFADSNGSKYITLLQLPLGSLAAGSYKVSLQGTTKGVPSDFQALCLVKEAEQTSFNVTVASGFKTYGGTIDVDPDADKDQKEKKGYAEGASASFLVRPTEDHVIESVTVSAEDGSDVPYTEANGVYTIEAMPKQNVTVSAAFAPKDGKKILYFNQAAFSNGAAQAANDRGIDCANYVNTGSVMTFDNVLYSDATQKLDSVTIVKWSGNGAQIQLNNGSVQTLEETNMTEKYGDGNTMHKVTVQVDDPLEGTGALEVKPSNGANYAGNYWYMILNYVPVAQEPAAEATAQVTAATQDTATDENDQLATGILVTVKKTAGDEYTLNTITVSGQGSDAAGIYAGKSYTLRSKALNYKLSGEADFNYGFIITGINDPGLSANVTLNEEVAQP